MPTEQLAKWRITAPAELAGTVVEAESYIAARAKCRRLDVIAKLPHKEKSKALQRLRLEEAEPAPPKPRASARRVSMSERGAVAAAMPFVGAPRPITKEQEKQVLAGLRQKMAAVAATPLPQSRPWGELRPLPEGSTECDAQASSLRDARVSAGVSIAMAARKLGLTPDKVVGLETGRYAVSDWQALIGAVTAEQKV